MTTAISSAPLIVESLCATTRVVLPRHSSSSKQAGALGSAAFAAVAAGIYPDITTAADAYAAEVAYVYKPIPENVTAYEALYREYKSLGEYFSRENGVMKRLLKIREEA